MATKLVFTGPRKADFQSYDEPTLEANQVRVNTLYSGISTGTELTAYRGSNPYMAKQWDASTRLFLGVPKEKASLGAILDASLAGPIEDRMDTNNPMPNPMHKMRGGITRCSVFTSI